MANKVDLAQTQKQVVKSEYIRDFATLNGLIYLGECSAFSNINIKESVEALINKVYEVQKNQEQVRINNSIQLNNKYGRIDPSMCGQNNCGNQSWCCQS